MSGQSIEIRDSKFETLARARRADDGADKGPPPLELLRLAPAGDLRLPPDGEDSLGRSEGRTLPDRPPIRRPPVGAEQTESLPPSRLFRYLGHLSNDSRPNRVGCRRGGESRPTCRRPASNPIRAAPIRSDWFDPIRTGRLGLVRSDPEGHMLEAERANLLHLQSGKMQQVASGEGIEFSICNPTRSLGNLLPGGSI